MGCELKQRLASGNYQQALVPIVSYLPGTLHRAWQRVGASEWLLNE